METRRNTLASQVRDSLTMQFKSEEGLKNKPLQAVRHGLSSYQHDQLATQIAVFVPAIFDKYITTGQNALLPDFEIDRLKERIINEFTKSAINEIFEGVRVISESLAKRNVRTDMSINGIYKDWAEGHIPHRDPVDSFIAKAMVVSMPVFEEITENPLFDANLVTSLRKNLRQSAERIYDDSNNDVTFHNIDAAKNTLTPDLKEMVLDHVARLTNTIVGPYQETSSFDQVRSLSELTQNMLTKYILEAAGKSNIAKLNPEDAETKMSEIIASSVKTVQAFLEVHVDLVNSFTSADPLKSDAKSELEMKELIQQVGDLTTMAGDIVANAPGLHGKISPTIAPKLDHIAAGGGIAFTVGTGIGALSLPAEYALAKFKGEKAPEMTKEKAIKGGVNTAGFGLAIAALCVPHTAVILTIVGATLGTVTAVGTAAHHFYEKSMLKKEINELLEKQIPKLQSRVDLVMKSLRDLSEISRDINEGLTMYAQEDIQKYVAHVKQIEGNLQREMAKLEKSTHLLSESISRLHNEFSMHSTAGVATGAVASSVYLAGASVIPVLGAASAALMLTSDLCAAGYLTASKISPDKSAVTKETLEAYKKTIDTNTTLFSRATSTTQTSSAPTKDRKLEASTPKTEAPRLKRP